MAAAFAHDPVNGRQAEPGPLAVVLGGEERLEDLLHGVFAHAATGVADGDNHVGAGLNLAILGGDILAQMQVERLDRQAAPVGHGIASQLTAKFMRT